MTATLGVVICAHNRAELLADITKAIFAQTIRIDVIIVDDSSIPRLDTYGIVRKYIWNRPDGLYHRVAKFNEGLSHVITPHTVLLDDDCVPLSEHWGQSFLDALAVHSVVRGTFLDSGEYKFPGWLSTTNLGFRTNLFGVRVFDPLYDGRYGWEDFDVDETLKAKGVQVALGDARTAVEHRGERFSGDRISSQENERLFKQKWGMK